MDTKAVLDTLLQHRSIRKYKDTPIEKDILHSILEAGNRASTIGNMQVYSIIVTQDKAIKEALSPCHFNQAMVNEAPALLTFVVDLNRFHKWCKLNNAEKSYDNFMWFVNGCIDALLAAQNICIAAEAHGLGICYLGTTLYTAEKIANILKLPKGVVPITSICMGYANEDVPLTDRLPLEGIVHYDTYKDYTDEDIRNIYRERENSKETKDLLEINNLPNLARVFTEKRYTKTDNVKFSNDFLSLLNKFEFMESSNDKNKIK